MKKVLARTLLAYSTADLWLNLEGDMILVMDDGEIVTNEKEIQYSSYVWEYHRTYPQTPLLLKHHVQSVTNGQRLGADSHLDLINNALWSAYDAYRLQSQDTTQLIDDLTRMSYEISNTIYNDLSYRLEEYVTSLDIMDFLQITMHPNVKNALEIMPPTEEGISSVHNEIKNLIKNDPAFKTNAVANAVQAKLASEGQAMHCLGPRGFLTDIDSHLFKSPIKRSFTQGIRSLHDSMIESRSAAKSLIFSTDPLQKSEYFSRRQQLICQNVQHLHLGDCGSQHYLTWHVRDARMEGSSKIGGDLKTIAGKYYLDEQSNTLKVVHETDTHLIGKTLKMRSVIAGCMHPDPYGVCEICYGETALAIPANSNLGHITCVAMTADLGQLILSTKHFDGSSVVEGIVLKQHEKRYLSAPINGSNYYLNSDLKDLDVKLIIASSQAMGLPDVNLVDRVDSLNISRVSEFDSVIMVVTDKSGPETVQLTVNVNGRLSNMTYQMLKHVKTNGWSVTKENNYVIDMAGWDYTQPILVLPMRHFNMSDRV